VTENAKKYILIKAKIVGTNKLAFLFGSSLEMAAILESQPCQCGWTRPLFVAWDFKTHNGAMFK